MIKMNREYFQKLIDEDLEWLSKQEHSCEKMHIEAIVRHSPYNEYDKVDIDKVSDYLKEHCGETVAKNFRSLASMGGFD